MVKRIFLLLFICSLVLMLLSATTQDSKTYINNTESFMKEIKKGNRQIYVDDITFDDQTQIQLNYPIEIIGKGNLSTLENIHFVLVGTNVPTETTSFTFKNIIFDGKVDKSQINFEENKTFDEIIQDTPQMRCIDASKGYYNLTIDNCEICNYLYEEGPALYINNDSNYREGVKSLELLNSKFHHNISNLGTVKVFSDVLTTNVDNCEFYANTARAGHGLAVGNGHSVIQNTKVHDNDFFHFVYYMERKLPNIFHDDKQTFKGLTTNSPGSCCGSIFIGGSHTSIDNCEIYNNKNIFGGGLGIFNSETQDIDEKVEVRNTKIFNNEAIYCGGAVYLESNQGETTYFNNCIMQDNKANVGSIIYTTTYAPDSTKSYGGMVQFAFCSLVNNTATDTNTFNFYDLLDEKLSGIISLKGCYVIDNGIYNNNSDDYNFIANYDEAIASGVINEKNILKPKKNSIADITIPVSEYMTWSDIYQDAKENKTIGYTEIISKQEFPWVIVIIIGVVVLIITASVIVFIKLKNKKQQAEKSSIQTTTEPDLVINYNDYTFEEISSKMEKEYGGLLTKTEVVVATYLLYDLSRKDIAKKLFVSDETVKWHLSNIFKKTNVSSKGEFKAQAEESIFSKK